MGLQVIYLVLERLRLVRMAARWTRSLGADRSLEFRAPLGWAVLRPACFFALLGSVLRRRITNADLPYLDSSLTSFSLVAQFYQTRKWIENWILWIAVDVIYVGMYIYKQLYLTAGLYGVFVILATLGYAEWRKSLPKASEATA